MKLTDDERRAFNAAMFAYWRSADDGISPGEAGFAAGIAYAQKWRSMESAPKAASRLLLQERDGEIRVGAWTAGAACWTSRGMTLHPTGWLPLPPTEAK